ncbi:MAG: response regulator [Acidimicrobiales bacterium]
MDDHPMVRVGLREALTDNGIVVVGEAGSVSEALSRILPLKPDIVLMDIDLPDGNGIDVCEELAPQDRSIKYIVLSAYTTDESAVVAIHAGAVGCLLKDVSSTGLVASLRAVASGGALFGPSVAAALLGRVCDSVEPLDPRLVDLTERELEVLRLLGKGRSNREIARTLFLAEKTVRNYVSNLLQKLGLHQRTEAALLAASLEHKRGLPTQPQ